MKKLKKLVYVLILLITACSFMACDQNAEGTSTYKGTSAPTPPPPDELEDLYLPANPSRPTGKSIGISMPSAGLQRWNKDGNNMKKILEAAGYYVYLMYAGNDINTQKSQIESMIENGCDVLIIAAVDGSSLTEVLEKTKTTGSNPYSLTSDIPVIAYDRLIMNSPDVSYYATFDNWQVGVLQGNYIRDTFDLTNRTNEYPIYMEFFTGDPGDNNINFFFYGALYVLSTYINTGVIVCSSGQTQIDDCTTDEWSTQNAYDRMQALIEENNYGPNGNRLDAVLCSNDSTAQGVIGALSDAGYTAQNFPVITGQDCDIYSVRAIKNGKQSMSVFKDTRILAAKTCEIVDAVILGTTVPEADTTTYYNRYEYSDTGTPVPVYVPSYLCNSMIVDASNYRDVLVGSGYYTNADLY